MNKTRAREELCEKLAAHPKFPWGKGLTLSGDHVLMSDDTFDPETKGAGGGGHEQDDTEEDA